MFDFLRQIDSPKIIEIKQNFENAQKQILFGISGVGNQSFVLGALGKGGALVAKDLVSASKIAENLGAYGFNVRFITSPFENALGLVDQNLKDDFFAGISDYLSGACDFLIILTNALLQKVPSKEAFLEHTLIFEDGKEYTFQNLSKMLVKMAYEKNESVFARGQFAIKGDTLFLWPINCSNIARLEFFDDTLEKISLLNPEDKKFVARAEKVVVCPRDLPLENQNILSVLDKVFFDEPKQLEGQIETLEESENFLEKQDVFKVIPKKALAFAGFTANTFFKPEKVFHLKTENPKNYVHNFKEFIEDLRFYQGSEKQIYVFCGGKENLERLEKILKENFVFTMQISGKETNIHLLEDFLPQTVHFYDAGAIFFGTNNIFAKTAKKKLSKKTKAFIPKINDYVVHEVHGIGKCVGLEKMAISGYEKEYIIIEYLGGDKFYLPSEKADELSFYGAGASAPKLNKLGGADFERVKSKVYKSVKDMAFDLLKLYAKREKLKGKVYEKDDYLMEQFEEAFPYAETDDQLRAIADIKADMESEKIMDRLVCGDVGFGKTEVAIRAIYKAVLSGSQVAFLCPTTILAEQHFKTCQKRFSGFMVKTARFNRLMTKKEEKEVLEGLSNGSIDVVVGTHKLLSKNVNFKNLTLLVLDEEQRFGVEDKEKIKNMKENIDVLSLSATPIPRTLHMSLSGIRDLSLIETPPRTRQPVQTFVTEFDEGLIQKAINQELARNGQILMIFNNIEKIYDFSAKIKKLVPNATIGVAHGRLSQKVLEDTIIKLYSGEYQILVSTTLIENGVDLPSANTLIVVDADHLGLSQAYQIRGRIGRSDKVAYAYFLIKQNKQISENAYKRLSALIENTSLGSGIKIA
ncbi:MAG: DEAD/DEAH box helicase, partial [Clostridia bacterium]|nr:DEAD/DEAH box helicase [Clostridia bacterium]